MLDQDTISPDGAPSDGADRPDSHTFSPAPLTARTKVAAAAGSIVSGLSRRLGRGSGSVIGGRAILAIQPGALPELSAGHDIALVSGTNGKTTTTTLLAAALGAGREWDAGPSGRERDTGASGEGSHRHPVVHNLQGANLPPGLAVALAAGEPGALAALEVDEAWLRRVVSQTSPQVALLLNLSRDQLDRNNEVRHLAGAWRETFDAVDAPKVVANADDPLVVWGAGDSDNVTWVGAGQPWIADASACPACGGRLHFPTGATDIASAPDEPAPAAPHIDASAAEPVPGAAESAGWRCTSCGRHRPELHYWVEDGEIVTKSGGRYKLGLRLPGRANVANAAMALAGAEALGIDPQAAIEAMGAVTDVGGRYRQINFEGRSLRLLLSKNPAGWLEVLDVLNPAPAPVVIAINARIADGRDPSWLWDVPFERLKGRRVVATGERSRDLAVRLRYADVDHVRVDDLIEAVRTIEAPSYDVVGNYTSFQDLVHRLERMTKGDSGPRGRERGSGPSGRERGNGPSGRERGNG